MTVRPPDERTRSVTVGRVAQPPLSIRQLSKSFEITSWRSWLGRPSPAPVQALRDISFDVEAGSVTALLGPNGSGKTTLMNIVADLVRADSGTVTVAGLPMPAEARAAQKMLGLVPTNERSFFWRLTGRQNLEFFAALEGFGRRAAAARTVELLEQFRLTGAADRIFRTYSAGMKKRLGLARALLSHPAVLLLDEPTNGLDSEAMEDLLRLVKSELAVAGCSILWATHRMDEVEQLCDRVVVLEQGDLRFHGSVSEFDAICNRGGRWLVQFQLDDGRRDALAPLVESVDGQLEDTGAFLRVTIDGGDEVRPQFLNELLQVGARTLTVERAGQSLHEAFQFLTRSDP